MSDVIVSGNTAVRKAPPPSVEVQLEPPTAGPEPISHDDDLRIKRIGGDPIALSEDGLREAIQKREPDPIYEWKAEALPEAGANESYAKQIRRASESMHSARIAALGETFAKAPGATPESGKAAAEAVVAAPATKVIPVGYNGQPIAPLLDDQPIREVDSLANLNEAKHAMRNFRDAQERERVALLESLQATAEQEARAEREAEQARVEAQKPAPQPAPADVQRAAIAQAQQEAAALNEIKRMSLNEAELAARIQRHEQEVFQRYPEVLDWNAWEHTQRTNPARAAEIQRAGAQSKVAVAQFAKMQEDRQLREHVVAQYQTQQATAQRAAWAAAEDVKFNQWMSEAHPEIKAKGRAELEAAAREMLTDDIRASYNEYGEARSFSAQKLIAEAAMWRVAQAKAKDFVKHKAVPSTQAPGVYAPRGAADMDRVADLQRELENAPNQRQALRIAQRLTQAKRAAGLLSGD